MLSLQVSTLCWAAILPALCQHPPLYASLLHMGLIRVFSPQLSTVSSRVSWQLSTGVRRCQAPVDKKRIETRQRLVFYTSDLKLHNQILAGGVAMSGHTEVDWSHKSGPSERSQQLEGSSSPVTTFCWMPSFQDPWQVLRWRLGDHGSAMGDLEMSLKRLVLSMSRRLKVLKCLAPHGKFHFFFTVFTYLGLAGWRDSAL